MSTVVYQARWILPVASPPIENGRLVVQDGCIVTAEKAGAPDSSAIDLGDSVVLPGFVNAHTHLMLTGCHGIRYRGSFTGWIRNLMAVHPRFAFGDTVRQSVREGLGQSMAAGVTTVGDIGDGVEVIEAWAAGRMNIAGFLEVVGIGSKRAGGHPKAVQTAAELLHRGFLELWVPPRSNNPLTHPGLFTAGLSPHAPYSTDACVYREAIGCVSGLSGICRRLCTHLAETREEEQFLRDGTGPFRELLEQFGLWDGSYRPPGCSPVEFMEQIGFLSHRPLLVHCNYVSDSDLDLIAASEASVAYCPRSHRFFNHEPHRWREMLARGINVCVGTDSLASNDTLSVLDELRFLRCLDPSIPGGQLIRMGTLAGARALGLDDQIGSLEVGKRADFTVIPLDRAMTHDPVEAVLADSSCPSSAFVGGCQSRDFAPRASE
ncbi:MAG: amidohydrolase family protein [Phycisphaerae bacterium]|nr:amidohydrolase family protein [Phycisphaerae bacterium]